MYKRQRIVTDRGTVVWKTPGAKIYSFSLKGNYHGLYILFSGTVNQNIEAKEEPKEQVEEVEGTTEEPIKAAEG